MLIWARQSAGKSCTYFIEHACISFWTGFSRTAADRGLPTQILQDSIWKHAGVDDRHKNRAIKQPCRLYWGSYKAYTGNIQIMIIETSFRFAMQSSPYDDVKWKHHPRYWSFVRGIHQSPVNSLHKGQWRGALGFSLICSWTNGWVNNCDADDLRRHHAHYYVTIIRHEMINFPQNTHRYTTYLSHDIRICVFCEISVQPVFFTCRCRTIYNIA